MLSLTSLPEITFKWPILAQGEALTLTLLVAFVSLSILEFYAPREKLPAEHLRRSYKTNLSLFLVNSLAMSLASVSFLLILAERYTDHGRLLDSIANPVWKAVLSFLLLDLLMYLWHIASHRFDCLWLFHRVHHNDPYLNVSTAFRIHFLELFIINILKALLIFTFGIEKAIVLTSETIMTLFIMFHHTNITFKGEKLLGHVIIVPALHRTHHSTQRREHDKNYGAVLSLWDRLFGTLTTLKAAEIGIKGNSPQDLVNLVKFGFSRQPAQAPNLDVMIAEAAYYKAEKRGFSPGDDLRDWLEAKQEIIALVYGSRSTKKSMKGIFQHYFLKLLNLNTNPRRVQDC